MIRSPLIALALLVSTNIWAAGPWMNKSYKNWDAKDLHDVLYRSQWVKHVTHTKINAPEGTLPGEGPTGMEYQGYHSKHAQPDDTHTTHFTVRWISSRTLREAWARKLVLQKKIPANEIDQHLPPAADEFELAVEGPDMSSFESAREAALKAKCYLAVESDKIGPLRVELVHARDGSIKGILFHFPTKNSAGEPTISTHAQRVVFVERGAGLDLDVIFHLQRMVDPKGRDL
jgi:hypothetical protein